MAHVATIKDKNPNEPTTSRKNVEWILWAFFMTWSYESNVWLFVSFLFLWLLIIDEIDKSEISRKVGAYITRTKREKLIKIW